MYDPRAPSASAPGRRDRGCIVAVGGAPDVPRFTPDRRTGEVRSLAYDLLLPGAVPGSTSPAAQTFRLAPDGGFWRLTLGGESALPQLFTSRSTALDAAILLAEQSAPCRLLVLAEDGRIEADLGFGLGEPSTPPTPADPHP